MASLTKLSEEQIAAFLKSLPDWSLVHGKLHREYRFADFVHAFGFMATAAVAIEAGGHHPEWFNVYNRVIVDLTTHDAEAITEKDTELAARLESIARKLQA